MCRRSRRLLDVTYGKGVFWKQVAADDYRVLGTDIQSGVDCTELPYDDQSLDALVLDPPYMEGLFRKDTGHMAGEAVRTARSGGTIQTVRRRTVTARSCTTLC